MRRGPRPTTIEHRLWTKVNRPSAAECWLWLGALDSHGYGIFSIWNGLEGRTKTYRAWRYVYALLNECEPPPGARVCGATPACVNPGHVTVRRMSLG